MKRNYIITFILACIPGAGQMYLGYMKRGLSLMLAAAVTTFVLNILSNSLWVIIPIIVAYSFFDTWHLRNQTTQQMYVYKDSYLFGFDDILNNTYDTSFFKKHRKTIGWVCIVTAGIIIVNEVFTPIIANFFGYYYISRAFNALIFASLLIWLGFYLLKGPKKNNMPQNNGYQPYTMNSSANGSTVEQMQNYPNYNTTQNGNINNAQQGYMPPQNTAQPLMVPQPQEPFSPHVTVVPQNNVPQAQNEPMQVIAVSSTGADSETIENKQNDNEEKTMHENDAPNVEQEKKEDEWYNRM